MKVLEIIGYLVKDAEVKQSPKGNTYMNFRVAVHSKSNGEDITDYIDVVSYNQVDTLPQYLKKGKQVFVRGNLNVSTNTGRDGKIYINQSISSASEIRFIEGGSGKKENENNATSQASAPVAQAPQAPVDEYRQAEAQFAPQVTPPAAAPQSEDPDDLPF
jgi:single stranded DNA-binding protein